MPPLVSVGIPLYRSRRFLNTIVDNIQAIQYGNVEILISDRHLLDDTLDVLRQRFEADSRVRFLSGIDGLNWVENYNVLLQEAKGKYFVWMPHDDTYPSNYIGELVDALENCPDAVLAFGRVESVSLDGFLPILPFAEPPVPREAEWSLAASLRTFALWQLWIAFRGLVRREVVEQLGLYIRPTQRNIQADIYWVFALSLRGRLLYVPSCCCTKRFFASSTGAGWCFDLRQGVNACRVLRSYLKDFARSRSDAFIAQFVVFPWCILQSALPAGWARRLLGAYQRHVVGRKLWVR